MGKDTGAPTGKWEAVPEALEESPEPADLRASGSRLLVRRPGVPEVEVIIDRSEFVIGRQASEVDLVVDDEWVSRRHAKLSVDQRGYFKLEDLGSQNGIGFQGRMVRRLNLVDGDEFGVGKTEFTFCADMSRQAVPLARSGKDVPPGAVPAPMPPDDGESSIHVPEPEPEPENEPEEQ